MKLSHAEWRRRAAESQRRSDQRRHAPPRKSHRVFAFLALGTVTLVVVLLVTGH